MKLIMVCGAPQGETSLMGYDQNQNGAKLQFWDDLTSIYLG